MKEAYTKNTETNGRPAFLVGQCVYVLAFLTSYYELTNCNSALGVASIVVVRYH